MTSPTETANKKSSVPPLTAAVVLVVAVALGGIVAVRANSPAVPSDPPASAADPDSADRLPAGDAVRIAPVTVNLDGGGYARVGVVVQLAELPYPRAESGGDKHAKDAKGDGPAVDVEQAKAVDALIAHLRAVTVADFEADAGQVELRAVIADAFEGAYRAPVLDVFFTDLIVSG